MAGWSSLARLAGAPWTRPSNAYQPLGGMDPLAGADDPDVPKPQAAEVEAVPTGQPGGLRDAAAALLDAAAAARVVLTAADNSRILRRIDRVILPILLVVYFLQALDKATLAYASVFGLLTDTNLAGEEYSWLGSVVYIAQLVMQPLVAFFLVKFPIGKFVGVVVLGWGIVLCCMALAHNFAGLLVTRFFLGAFEASVAPAFVAVTQMWWRRAEQTNRVAAWYSMNGITNMVGSLLAYGLGHINSRLKSYQIIFLFCGLLTVVFSFVIFVFLPDSPVEAKFLNEKDKLIAVERLRMNQMGVMSRTWRWEHLRESFLDLKTWCWFAMIFSVSIPSGGISTFGPLIVQSFGFDSFTTILFNIPFGAVQIVATMGGAFLATRIKMKGPVLILLCIPPVIGCAMLMAIDHVTGSKAALLVGYYLISVYPGISCVFLLGTPPLPMLIRILAPLIYSWSAQNTAGDTKRKCTTGFLFVGQSAGNIIGPHLYTTEEAPQYTRGLVSNLSLYIIIIILVIFTTIHLHLLNRRHAARRVALGKSALVVDTSMLDVQDDDDDGGGGDGDGDGGGGDGIVIGHKAFHDETDLRNEDFIFVY